MSVFTGSSAYHPHAVGIATLREMLGAALAQCWKTLERLFTRTSAPYY